MNSHPMTPSIQPLMTSQNCLGSLEGAYSLAPSRGAQKRLFRNETELIRANPQKNSPRTQQYFANGEYKYMPAPPRVLIKGKLHLISTRVERGLPFVCTAYMNLIIMSVMARAQALYKVRVCAFIWMGNHLHLLVVVDCPASVTAFMDRIKTETSHAINRLTGERKLTNWCDSYDSPPILTVEDAIEKFVYLYANPVQANLETSISL